LNSDIVGHDLGFDAVNLRGLLPDLLLELSQVVLKRLDELLSYLLLLLQSLLAGLALLPPVLKLLVHALKVIRNELDTPSQRIGTLA